MPELPEVEWGRKVAEGAALGRKIKKVHCQEDRIVFCKRSATEVEKLLRGREVKVVARKGKYIWFELDRGPHPIFHFGMTGAFRRPEETPLRLSSSAKTLDSSWPPKFWKIKMEFDDGAELAMTNARRLGRIRLVDDPPKHESIAKLGFDPLTETPSVKEFLESLRRRKGNVKGLLLNQQFAAGVGNWIADEVLFQSQVDPRRSVESLSEEERKELRKKLLRVISFAVKVDARKDKFPKDWLFHYRWGKNKDALLPNGEKVEFLEIAGRSTAWVPSLQK